MLSVISNGTELCPTVRAAARTVRPAVQAILDQLEPTPAFVINHLSDLLAWTDAYDQLARPLGILDSGEPNLLSFVLTDARAREAYADWDAVADELVAALHAQAHEPGSDVRLFAERLVAAANDPPARWSASPEFRDLGTTRPRPAAANRLPTG